MKKTITKKLSYLALGLLCFSPQLKAEDVKVDYTDHLVNPSFEYYVKDGAVDLTDPIDLTNSADTRLYKSALRGTPPGWSDSGVTLTSTISYGINRGATAKDGFNTCWYSPGGPSNNFVLYQEVPNLPAGQYVVSCRMMTFAARLTDQRLFVQTKAGENITNNIVQYIGTASDYSDLNLTLGETNTYAGWELGPTVNDAEGRLKPMSIVVDIAEGEVLVLGLKSGNVTNTGVVKTKEAAVKLDDFRITKVVAEDPNDYTSHITNPSFEQILVNEVPTQLKSHNIVAYTAEDPQRGVPYGWQDIIDDSGNPNPNPSIGESYGVNTDANGIDGAKNLWALRTPFVTSYTLYQDITNLPSGRYAVSCSMFVQDGGITTQRLFANNNVVYYGTAADYEQNLTVGEINSFAGLTTSTNNNADGQFLKKMTVEVDVQTNASLRIGVKSSNIKKDLAVATGSEGWFKLDNFRLQRIGDVINTVNNNVVDAAFSVSGQKDGCWLNLDKATLANVKVISLSGQTVYSSKVNVSNTWISLPQGLYIVQVTAEGTNKSVKVLVK